MSKDNEPTAESESVTENSVFDPKNLRLPQDFSVAEGVRRLIHTIPVQKPTKQEFVRTHPGADYQMDAALIDCEEDRQTYLVTPDIAAQLSHHWYPVRLFLTVTRQVNYLLWPVKQPKDRSLAPLLWHTSAMEAATQAKDAWLRVQANMGLQAYDLFIAEADIPEPEWPDLDFSEVLEIAFKGRIIDRLDHSVLLRLEGRE